MSVIDSIAQARAKGASDDMIVAEILKQNPAKALVFQEAKKRGADSATILNEITKQNMSASTPDSIVPEKQGFFKSVVQNLFGGSANLATRPGQLLGVGVAKTASAITGNQEYYDRALSSLDKPFKSAIGTDVKPISQETAKSVTGEALGTVAFGVGSPIIGGALLGASVGLEKDGSAGEVTLDAVVGAVTGKVFEVGFKAASPYITKAIAKYGTPALEQLQKALPDYAKPYLDDLIKSGNVAIQRESLKQIDSISQKSMEDALGFVKKRDATPTEMKQAFIEGRAKTNAKGQQELITTPQQQKQAEALQPLIESGDLKPSKTGLPTPEQRDIVIQRVEQLNQGLKTMVSNPKYNQPFNDRQLIEALNKTKKDTAIIFASDPTIEKTYNALIDVAYEAVKTNNVAGLLEARQIFDKLPAVKKLLDSAKGTGVENLRREGILAIRGALNNFAADLLSKGGVGGTPAGKAFLKTLRTESDLLGAVKSMSDNYPTAFVESNKTFFQKHPILKNAAWWVGGIGTAGLGIPAVKGIFND